VKVIQEAIKAFQFEHEFRCSVTKRKCNHLELIEQAYEMEPSQKLAEQKLIIQHLSAVNEKAKQNAIEQLENIRKDWLQVQDLPHGSFASWVDSVFAIAIKAVKEIK
jgi:hypothetical protein